MSRPTVFKYYQKQVHLSIQYNCHINRLMSGFGTCFYYKYNFEVNNNKATVGLHSVSRMKYSIESFRDESALQDHSDPIIRKYKKILDDMSANRSPVPEYETEEVKYKTNFGAVRFDSDNTPKLPASDIKHFERKELKEGSRINTHEDFDDLPTYKIKNFETKEGTNMSLNRPIQDNDRGYKYSDLNFIDKNYFKESLSNVDSNSSIAPSYENNMHKSVSNIVDSITADDLNFIDEQYLKENLKQNSSSSSNTKSDNITDNKSNDISSSELHKVGLSYVDSLYFTPANDSIGTSTSKIKVENLEINYENHNSQNYYPRHTKDIFEVESSSLSKKNVKSNVQSFSDINKATINIPVYNFEDSILDDLDNAADTPPSDLNSVVTDEPVHESNRGSIEEKLFQLSEKTSQDLLKRNPKPKRKHDLLDKKLHTKEENEDEMQTYTDSPSRIIQDTGTLSSKKNESEKLASKEIQNRGTTTNMSDELEKFKFPESAFDYAMKRRRQEYIDQVNQIKGEILPHEHFKKILLNVPRYHMSTQHDIALLLKKSVLYNDNNVVAFYKPYGIPSHSSGENNKKHRFNIVGLLPHMADIMRVDTLIPVHRLDINTTGVMLLARTEEVADKLKNMFKNHSIRKTYLALTKGVPSVLNGIIDIPIAEGRVEQNRRMVLFPDVAGCRGKGNRSKKAITRYKVLAKTSHCSLLEVHPITGLKHQIRVHLGFGIDCPVLGDHKYSYLKKIAPQKLSGEALHLLGMKQSSVRHMPMHLHSLNISIPGLAPNGGEIFVSSGPPKFFKHMIRALKLNHRNNRLINDYEDIIYEF